MFTASLSALPMFFQDHSCVLNSIVGWDSTIGKWARVEGTPSDPNPNDPYAKIDSETLFRDGKLTPSITILGIWEPPARSFLLVLMRMYWLEKGQGGNREIKVIEMYSTSPAKHSRVFFVFPRLQRQHPVRGGNSQLNRPPAQRPQPGFQKPNHTLVRCRTAVHVPIAKRREPPAPALSYCI